MVHIEKIIYIYIYIIMFINTDSIKFDGNLPVTFSGNRLNFPLFFDHIIKCMKDQVDVNVVVHWFISTINQNGHVKIFTKLSK